MPVRETGTGPMRRTPKDAEEWLAFRREGLGASDASCVLGVNPWKTNLQLWEEKTGRRQAPILADKPAIAYGKQAEESLRVLFCLDFQEYAVEYDPFGMLYLPERPWLFATLDGELTKKETGRRGVLEIKTTELRRSADWSKWDDQVPDYYYTQVLHQLLATGWDYVVLKAQLKWQKGGEMQITTRHYKFERADCKADMDVLLDAERAFWADVQADRRPAALLPTI